MMLDQVYPLVLNKDTLSPAIQICCLMMDQTLFHLGLHQDKEILDERKYQHQILQSLVLAVAFFWHILFVQLFLFPSHVK